MKLPQLVLIEFLDHCIFVGGEEARAIPCEVVGMLHKIDKDVYHIATWISDKVIDNNTDQYAILKSSVKKITTLKQGKRLTR